MRIKHKTWAEPFLEEHNELVITIMTLENDSNRQFINKKPIYMEIGTGKGDFILGMAKENPDINFLGVEINATALAFCAKKIVENNLNNVKLINLDVKYLLEHLPRHHFEGIFLNFSDPWPKKRHAKRRLTYPEMLKGYASILVDNGRIIQKTDNDDLFVYSLESFKETNWEIISVDNDYQKAEFDVPTEYEMKFRSKGKNINRAIVQKGGNTDEFK